MILPHRISDSIYAAVPSNLILNFLFSFMVPKIAVLVLAPTYTLHPDTNSCHELSSDIVAATLVGFRFITTKCFRYTNCELYSDIAMNSTYHESLVS